MFQKLVAIEPVSLVLSAEKALYSFADEVVMYSDIPAGDNEIIARIGDADAVLLSYTSQINRYILERCPNVRYIGMCCSLYSPESANVDIRYANERGITVTGIRDYGDEGVIEYVVSELVRCLHGFGQKPWEGIPREITGLKAVSSTPGSYLHNFVTAFFVTLSNPLIIFLFIGLFARFSFVMPGSPIGFQLVGYLAIVLGALLWWFGITYFVNKVRTRFNLRGIWILNRVIGIVVMLISVAGFIYTILGKTMY